MMHRKHSQTSHLSKQTTSTLPMDPKLAQLNNFIQDMQAAPATSRNPREDRQEMGQRVLQAMKNKIKGSYNTLYQDYQQNRPAIRKRIQAVETQMAGDNAMQTKFEDLAKDKAKHDKVKAAVNEKKRKLKKLIEIRDQLALEVEQEKAKGEKGQEKSELEQLIDQIVCRKGVLDEMLATRKKVELSLKQRHQNMTQDLSNKRNKIRRLKDENVKKTHKLAHLEDELLRQDELTLPDTLAEQLTDRLQSFENAHCYDAILQHECELQDQRSLQEKIETQRERESQRTARAKREQEEKVELENCMNLYMIKSMEEEKVKRLCGVSDFQQIFQQGLGVNCDNLEEMEDEIQREIAKYEGLNSVLKRQVNQGNFEAQPSSKSDSIDRSGSDEAERDRLQKEWEKMQEQSATWRMMMELIAPGDTGDEKGREELIRRIEEGERNDKMPSKTTINTETQRTRLVLTVSDITSDSEAEII